MTSSTLKKLKYAGSGLFFACIGLFFIFPYFLTDNSLFSTILAFASVPLMMLLFLVGVIFLLINQFGQDSVRKSEFKKFSQKTNWAFQPEADLYFLRDDAARLQLGEYLDFHPLHGETRNLISGKIHNVDGVIKYGELTDDDLKNYADKTHSFDAMIFDQIISHDVWEHGFKLESFTSGNPNRSGTKTEGQTMFLVRSKDFWFPPFCVEPEGFWQKLHAKLENNDVDFPEFPVFSHKYKFFGGFFEDEIRNIFNDDVLRFYERQEASFVTIGHEDRLLIYEPENLVSSASLQERLTFIIKLANHFLKSKDHMLPNAVKRAKLKKSTKESKPKESVKLKDPDRVHPSKRKKKDSAKGKVNYW